MQQHEDERRLLTSFPEAKLIKVKEDCVLGNHYHKVKTEIFVLCKGEGVLISKGVTVPMEIGEIYEIQPETLHEFHIKKGSVLIGLNSHPYDPQDDYKE